MFYKVFFTILLIAFPSISLADESSKDQKINELIHIMDMDSLVDSMYLQMEAMMQNMSSQMGVKPSEQPIFDEYYNQMTLIVQEDMSWAKMEPFIVDIYRRNFSEKEIDDMLAFYRTETGKSLLKKMPVITQESMQVSQTLIQGSIPKIQKIAEEFGEALAKSRNRN